VEKLFYRIVTRLFMIKQLFFMIIFMGRIGRVSATPVLIMQIHVIPMCI